MNIKDYEYIASSAAKRIGLVARQFEYGDLYSWAWIGLMKANELYDITQGGFEPFATRCVYNAIHTGIRGWSGRRFTVVEQFNEDIDPYGVELDPERILIRRERIQACRDAINRLPEQMAVVVKLYALEGMSATQVGIVAGITAQNVYTTYNRAVSKLREDEELRRVVFGL